VLERGSRRYRAVDGDTVAGTASRGGGVADVRARSPPCDRPSDTSRRHPDGDPRSWHRSPGPSHRNGLHPAARHAVERKGRTRSSSGTIGRFTAPLV